MLFPSRLAAADSLLILKTQAAMNLSTRGQWELYGPHRRQIERLIVPAKPGGRACVLGAGNCNDLDLNWLKQVFAEIHLVDLDADALETGVRRQGCTVDSCLCLHAPVDLSGIGEIVTSARGAALTDESVNQCLAHLATPVRSGEGVLRDLPGFDLVLSPCVLSQLLVWLRNAVGVGHPRVKELRAALRTRHLRMMADLLAPDGQGVILLDLASDKEFPDLARVTTDRLEDLKRNLIDQGKCFAALTPKAIEGAIRSDEKLARTLCDVRQSPSWIWHLGLRKSFLVYAFQFRKKGARVPML